MEATLNLADSGGLLYAIQHLQQDRDSIDKRAVRVVPADLPGGTFYVFLVFPPVTYAEDHGQYREARGKLLEAYCMATKHAHPHAEHIVGLACSSLDASQHSEDAVYLDAREWSPEQQAEAEALRRDLNLLNEVTVQRAQDQEYPAGRAWSPRLKNPRNKPCPCGSGRKYKHCHGRS